MQRVVLDRSVTRTSRIETTASLRASETASLRAGETASLRASEGPRPETPDPDETRRSDSTRGGGATDGVPSPRAEPVAAGAAAAPQLRPEASAWRALDAAAPTDAAEPKQGKPIGDEALPEARAAAAPSASSSTSDRRAPRSPETDSPASARSRGASAAPEMDSSAHTRSSSDSLIEDPHAADRAAAHAAVRLAKRAENKRRQRKAKHERRRPSEIVLSPA